MESLGWSESNENLFKKYNKDLIIKYKGNFQILKRNNIWYWFFKLSSGNDRLQYLCKCFDDSDTENNTSFDRTCDVLKNKIKLSFKGTRVSTTNLSKFIEEYTDFLANRGNLEKQARIKGGIAYSAWVKKDDGIESMENPITIRNKIRVGFIF